METKVETRNEAISRRIRGKMGERRITGVKLGEMLGITQGSISRRLTNEIPLDVDFVDKAAEALGTSADYLFTGKYSASDNTTTLERRLGHSLYARDLFTMPKVSV